MTRCKAWIGTAAALSVLFGAWVSAQEDEKQLPPEGGTPKNFTLPEKDTFERPNGLRVTMVQIGSVPKATVRIVIRSGNLNEGDQTWLADLSGDFLLEGTASRNSEDIAREAAAMGGQVTVTVTEDRTTISGDALSDFVPQMAALLADVTRNPEFPASELERIVEAVGRTGYGLTFGIQTRIEGRSRAIAAGIAAGNVYINRNMVGAVVGVQPFGGQGLSGTGPKAGGPHYLARFVTEKTITVNTAAVGGNATLLAQGDIQQAVEKPSGGTIRR